MKTSELELPILIHPETIVLPGVTTLLTLSDSKSLRHLDSHSGEAFFIAAGDANDLKKENVFSRVKVECVGSTHETSRLVQATGIDRVRISSINEERSCEFEVLSDQYHNSGINRRAIRLEILHSLNCVSPELMRNRLLLSALEYELPLGRLCDVIAGGCNFHQIERNQILQEIDVDQRCELVRNFLDRLIDENSKRPTDGMPEFSLN